MYAWGGSARLFYFFLVAGPVPNAPERSWHASGPIFRPNGRFWTRFGPFLMIWARTDILGGTWTSRTRPSPGLAPLKSFPSGGRDGGRLGLSVRTWLAEAATAADLTQASEIAVRYITLGSVAKGYGLGQGLPSSPWPGPGDPSPAKNVGSGPNHQKWSESGPEATVWPENRSRSMPGPFRSVSDRSRDQKKVKKSGQAVPC